MELDRHQVHRKTHSSIYSNRIADTISVLMWCTQALFFFFQSVLFNVKSHLILLIIVLNFEVLVPIFEIKFAFLFLRREEDRCIDDRYRFGVTYKIVKFKALYNLISTILFYFYFLLCTKRAQNEAKFV